MTTATGATARDPGRETSPWPALSPQERGERGRAARREVPRSVHAAWAPAPDRRAPVDILEEQSADRLPDLVPVRYGRMLESPFAFFRGAAGLMAPDLAHTPVSGLHAQLCGDAHVANFGGFASPERELVFDINDFDETARPNGGQRRPRAHRPALRRQAGPGARQGNREGARQGQR